MHITATLEVGRLRHCMDWQLAWKMRLNARNICLKAGKAVTIGLQAVILGPSRQGPHSILVACRVAGNRANAAKLLTRR